MADDPDLDDLHLVADAYRGEYVSGGSEQAAFQAALRAYLAAHPEREAERAAEIVTDLLYSAGLIDAPRI